MIYFTNLLHYVHFKVPVAVDFLQRQLKNLKDNLKKCLEKRKQMTRSGAAASSLPKCKYYEQMEFLHEKTANMVTESNIILVEGDPIEEGIFDGPSTSQKLAKSIANTCNKRKASEIAASGKQKRKDHQERYDSAILKELEATNTAIKSVVTTDNEDEVSLYC